MGRIEYLRHPLKGGNATRTPEYSQGPLIGEYVRLLCISSLTGVVCTALARGTAVVRPHSVTIPAFGHALLTVLIYTID